MFTPQARRNQLQRAGAAENAVLRRDRQDERRDRETGPVPYSLMPQWVLCWARESISSSIGEEALARRNIMSR